MSRHIKMIKLKLLGRKDSGEAPLYCFFAGLEGMSFGALVDKYLPRNQTSSDYGGEKRWTYVLQNPFDPSKTQEIVGVKESLVQEMPILFEGQPRNVGGYRGLFILQDYYGNILNQVIPRRMEFEIQYYMRRYFLLRKESSKLLVAFQNAMKREEIPRKAIITTINDFKNALYTKHEEDKFGARRF